MTKLNLALLVLSSGSLGLLIGYMAGYWHSYWVSMEDEREEQEG